MFERDTVGDFDSRLRRVPVILAALYLLVAAITAILRIELQGDSRVFDSFWASGDAWLRGLNPYAVLPDTWVVEIPGADILDVNLNPPVTLPIMALIASVPVASGAVGWVIASTILIISCCFAICRETGANDFKLAWALSCAAVIDTLLLVQIYALILLLGTVIWFALRRAKITTAIVALGILVAFKPNFALALPVLLLAGQYRFAIGSAVVASALTLFSFILVGPEIFLQWLAAVRADSHWVFPTTVSLMSYFQRLGAPGVGILAALAPALAAFIWAHRTRPQLERALILGLVVSMVAAPLCWFHYTLVLVPFMMNLPWNRSFAIGAGLLWVPPFVPLLSIRGDLFLQGTLGAIYFVGLSLVGIGLLTRAEPENDPGALKLSS